MFVVTVPYLQITKIALFRGCAHNFQEHGALGCNWQHMGHRLLYKSISSFKFGANNLIHKTEYSRKVSSLPSRMFFLLSMLSFSWIKGLLNVSSPPGASGMLYLSWPLTLETAVDLCFTAEKDNILKATNLGHPSTSGWLLAPKLGCVVSF